MAETATDDRLAEIADQLYGVDPDDFVARRAEASRAAKQAGDRELADAIGALRKPTAAAWALNSFARADGAAIDAVLAVGRRLLDAVERGDGDAIRELMRERARAIADTAAEVRRCSEERGESLSAAVGAQVEQTLRAAMVSEDGAGLLRRGVLAGALEESGFGTMRAPVASRPSGHDDSHHDAESTDAADDSELAVTEQRVAAAEGVVARAEEELATATTHRTRLEAERDDLRRRLDDVERQLHLAADSTTGLAARLDDARAELRAARAALRRRR